MLRICRNKNVRFHCFADRISTPHHEYSILSVLVPMYIPWTKGKCHKIFYCIMYTYTTMNKEAVSWDFLSGFLSWFNRLWGMILVSIFSLPIFGDFNDSLPNSILLERFQSGMRTALDFAQERTCILGAMALRTKKSEEQTDKIKIWAVCWWAI